MRCQWAVALVAAAGAASPARGVLPQDDSWRALDGVVSEQAVPGSWLAVVKGTEAACTALKASVAAAAAAADGAQLRAAGARSRSMRIASTCVVAFEASEAAAQAVRKLKGVLYVEQNAYVRATAEPASWGLDRIDQASLPLDRATFTEGFTGVGQTVYVIDTGIAKAHVDFGGRAVEGPNFSSDETAADGNGHGTHCAGTATGARYGIATKATVVGVKVLPASGSGPVDRVIKGIEWAVRNQAGKGAAVISISLGGGGSALNDAVAAAAKAGHIVTVSAGNDSYDACQNSPAGAGGRARVTRGVVTVGATTYTDARASWSNYGSCVDIFAPGSDITSAWWTSTTASATLSGTSMACPHVAGVAATLLEKYAGNKARAMADLFASSVANKVTNSLTPNGSTLLQVARASATPTAPTKAPTSAAPTKAPTSAAPTKAPTSPVPTEAPTTTAPTTPAPTAAPTTPVPTAAPTTTAPSNAPTTKTPRPLPTRRPTRKPTTRRPTTPSPTRKPSNKRARPPCKGWWCSIG
jgi:subtilisin family serine protease